MPRSKKQNEEIKEQTAARIREAGLKLFSHKGLAATSSLDIAKQAEVSTGLMYHYYKSKEDLYSELIGTAMQESNIGMRYYADMDVSASEKVRLFTEHILAASANDEKTSRYFLLMVQAMLDTSLPEQAKNYMKDIYKSSDILKEIIVSGQEAGDIKQGDPHKLTILFLSAIHGLCVYRLTLGEQFRAPDIEMVTILLTNK